MIDQIGIMPRIIAMITPAEYQTVRESIGSQRDVAKLLGVDIRTVQRRECGEIAITFEATRVLFSLSALNRLRQLIAKVTDNGIKRELDDLVALLEAH
jgi:transcriptional regulator with XRE-family HTH domain